MSPWISFVLFISRYCCLPFAIGGSDVHTCCCRDIITYSTYFMNRKFINSDGQQFHQYKKTNIFLLLQTTEHNNKRP
jgi:hypothetical protein